MPAHGGDTARARTNKGWAPRRVRKVVTADGIPLALRIIRPSLSARGQRSPFIQVSHRTTFGKLWRVDSFAALLVEWTYSKHALFPQRVRASQPTRRVLCQIRGECVKRGVSSVVLAVGGLGSDLSEEPA
jgi:hypothetical protein